MLFRKTTESTGIKALQSPRDNTYQSDAGNHVDHAPMEGPLDVPEYSTYDCEYDEIRDVTRNTARNSDHTEPGDMLHPRESDEPDIINGIQNDVKSKLSDSIPEHDTDEECVALNDATMEQECASDTESHKVCASQQNNNSFSPLSGNRFSLDQNNVLLENDLYIT